MWWGDRSSFPRKRESTLQSSTALVGTIPPWLSQTSPDPDFVIPAELVPGPERGAGIHVSRITKDIYLPCNTLLPRSKIDCDADIRPDTDFRHQPDNELILGFKHRTGFTGPVCQRISQNPALTAALLHPCWRGVGIIGGRVRPSNNPSSRAMRSRSSAMSRWRFHKKARIPTNKTGVSHPSKASIKTPVRVCLFSLPSRRSQVKTTFDKC